MEIKKLFTSESVGGNTHPDFVASGIADAILDHCMKYDPYSHCGIEVLCTPNRVTLGGEVTTTAPFDDETIADLVRSTVNSFGYDDPELGFCGCPNKDCKSYMTVDNFIHTQSPDINQGVDNGVSTGSGDQGIMFGFATNETKDFYPLAAQIANEIMRTYLKVFKQHRDILSPDAKSQVTFNYTDNVIDTIVVAASHKESADYDTVYNLIVEEVVRPAVKNVILGDGTSAIKYLVRDTQILVNTTGKFVLCGPFADSGVCGRKITVDSYGGYARVGGGNIHGKDITKTDATLAFYSRYLAKNLVAAGVADKLEIQLASAIGVAEPIAIFIDTFGTGKVDENEIAAKLLTTQNMALDNIIETLHLRETERLSTNEQFMFGVPAGETDDPVLKYHHTWERLDKVQEFKELFGLYD